MKRFEIHQPVTTREICTCLTEFGEKAVLHAGGTDMLVRLRDGLIAPCHIIDLSKVDALKSIETLPNGKLRIGSMVTLSALSSHSAVKTQYQALDEASQSIGSLQIRNRGTLVGNICNASPAADTVPALLIFEATLNLRGPDAVRNIPIENFISGPGETGLAAGEFVESVELPQSADGCASAYLKIGRRKAVDCSIASVAVRLGLDKSVYVALGAVAEKPIRAYGAEKFLSGRQWDQSLIDRAGTLVRSEVRPIDDIRASRAYREEMSVVLFRRVFDLAKRRLNQDR